MTTPVYTAIAHASGGGRDGHVRSEDDRIDLDTRPPKEMGGSGEGTNPEQLFAAGYSACFMGALKFVASKEKVSIPADASIDAHIGIGPREDGGGFAITAKLEIKVPGLDRAVVEDLVAKADIVCPYSHATRGNIEKTLVVL